MATKVDTAGDRFSITVHVTSDRKFLRSPEYRYQVVIRDEQAAKAAEERARKSPGFGYGMLGVPQSFSTDDPQPLIDALRAAADALEAEVRA